MDSTTVKVNVGGTVFTTTLSTLQKAKYFSELALEPDLSDQVIDRDPLIFTYLLNCLRDNRYIKLEKLQEYQPDIDYFAMDCLKAEVKEQLPIITVDPDSKFKVVIWKGLPVIQVKEELGLTEANYNEIQRTGVRITLPYDGRVHATSLSKSVINRVLGWVAKGSSTEFNFRFTESRRYPPDSDLFSLHFYRDYPQAELH
jgi:hypothetical protein